MRRQPPAIALRSRGLRGQDRRPVEVDADQVTQTCARSGVSLGSDKPEVPATTLDRPLENSVAEIDFISVDANGAELDVLTGCDLERYKPSVLLVAANSAPERQELDVLLAKRGYRLARSIARSHFYVRTKQDLRALRGITVSARLARPRHPSGAPHDRFGYPASPYVYWPAQEA
jgi:hypothetical protein